MHWLLYVDPSPRGAWALALAEALPVSLAERMTLLATEDDLVREPGLLAAARARLERSGRAVTDARRAGPAEMAILAEASASAPDVVLVPPAGRNALQRMLRGSRVASVVRSVPASVLVARRPAPGLRRVLAAVSEDESAEPVTRATLLLAETLGIEPTFLHVASGVALPGQDADAAPPATAPLEAVLRMLREGARPHSLLVREGLVVDEVLREVDSGAHDLLVIGTSPVRRPEAAGHERWTRADVTERILLQCPVSVLVVRGALRRNGSRGRDDSRE